MQRARTESMTANSNIRILVVEDDDTVRYTFSTVLEREGYNVSTANDGFDALLHLQREVPDVILSDLNMPQMSGFELLSVVRRRFPHVMVVAASGAYTSSAVPEGVIADAFYAKGQESAAKLLEIIANLIRTGPMEHKGINAPVWIPRNGTDHNGRPFVVLTCTECLRSFPFIVDHEPTGEVLKTACKAARCCWIPRCRTWAATTSNWTKCGDSLARKSGHCSVDDNPELGDVWTHDT